MNKYLQSTIKEASWKYIDIVSIYNENNILELFNKELLHINNYENNLNFNMDKNTIVIINGKLVFDYYKLLRDLSILEIYKYDRGMIKLAIENSDHFAINIDKNNKYYLKLIFINDKIARNKLINISISINLNMFARLDLDIDFINLYENSAINIFLYINISEGATINFINNSNKNLKNSKLIITISYLINLEKDAVFNGFNLVNKLNLLKRGDFIVNLNKPFSRFNMRGVYLVGNKTIANDYFLVNHNASHTFSNIDFRGLANDSAKIYFNAKTIINKNISFVEAYQNNKNIQLSNKAEINTKPELEIFSNKVICNHSATIGQLDQDALFYLQSRGLELYNAKYLLLKNFIKYNLISNDFYFTNKAKKNIIKYIDYAIDSILH